MNPNVARALAVLAEALVEGRRVLVVADSSLGLHAMFADLGARLVHVYDPDTDRAMAQPPPTERGHVLRGLPEGDFDVRDGAFDLAFVPDLTIVDDPAALLARLRRVVGNEGALLCAAHNKDADAAEGLDYYELYDLVSMQFANIRMLATMPFEGVTIAELGQDEVDTAVRVDTQLAEERETPEVFVALASQQDVALDAYSVIELPAAERPAAEAVPSDAATVSELAAARLRAKVLEARIEELGASGQKEARAAEELRRVLEALDAERQRSALLERELDRERLARAADTSGEQLAAAGQRIAALEEGVQLAEQTIIALRDRLAQIESTFEQADEERGLLRAELEQRVAQASSTESARALEVRVAELESELAMAHDAHAEDHAALEATLRDRGEAVALLTAEVARREKIVRELLVALEQQAGAPREELDEGWEATQGEVEPSLRHKLDELARLAAAQQSELEARAWRIGELERALEPREAPSPPAAAASQEVERLRDELNALRQALTQEHADKQRARAELQRQAVLIEQLSGRKGEQDRGEHA